ncbi:PLD nuclease N-terminal domain-containing protein [Solicola sp. PLA-1-18]|uniref:PLD nuclease N-terminal domain-containing protein n=1 Tax=Solicola sp. PLA-1-18 TaxID=3380532 RepID=UPI003B7C06C3
MLLLDSVLGLVLLALWVFCLVDVITTDSSLCRNLPKVAWIVVVLLFSFLGSVAWLVAGRPQRAADLPYRGSTGGAFPEYERPGRFVGNDTASDEEFLRQCRERAEEQRRRYRESRGDS